MGYGAALRAGFQAARFELVAFTDADCQFELSDLGYMLPLAEQFDIVSGYRIDRKDPVKRRFFSWGYNTLVQLLMGSRIRDIDLRLKIYHRDSLQQILPEANNFFANTEMLSKARSQDLSVVDVGVRHRPRAAGESKVSLWDIPETLKSLLPFWWTRVLFTGGTTRPPPRSRSRSPPRGEATEDGHSFPADALPAAAFLGGIVCLDGGRGDAVVSESVLSAHRAG